MRYKIISLLIVALMIISNIGVTATGTNIQIRIADVCDIVGSTARVPVVVENNSGFASFTIIISYNNENLKPLLVSKGDMLNGTLITNLEYAEDAIKLVYASAEDVTKDGVAFLIEFEVLSNEPIKSSIGIDVGFLGDAAYTSPDCDIKDGSIEIVEEVIPFESCFSRVSSYDETYDINVAWKNKTANAYDKMRVFAAACDANGKILNIVAESHSFYPGEIYEISWQFQSESDVKQLRMFTWTDDLQPVISVMEQEM